LWPPGLGSVCGRNGIQDHCKWGVIIFYVSTKRHWLRRHEHILSWLFGLATIEDALGQRDGLWFERSSWNGGSTKNIYSRKESWAVVGT
jgi:hypothetical protein